MSHQNLAKKWLWVFRHFYQWPFSLWRFERVCLRRKKRPSLVRLSKDWVHLIIQLWNMTVELQRDAAESPIFQLISQKNNFQSMKMSLLETMSAWFLNPSSERRFFVKLLDNRSHFLFQGLYYGASICLVSFASAMAVVTLNIHYRGLRGGSVPPWIRTIALGYLAKYVHNVYVFGTHDHHELCFHYFYEWQHHYHHQCH